MIGLFVASHSLRRALHALLVLGCGMHAVISLAQKNSTAIVNTPSGSTFQATSGRPLKNLTISLASEHGWLVDYEDAPIEASSAFEDTSTPQWRLEHNKGFLSLKNRSFSFGSSYSIVDSAMPSTAVLQQLLVKYNNDSANPDAFSLVQETDGRISIVGTAVRNDSGVIIARQPILNVSIQLTNVKQNLLDAIIAITDQLTRVAGRKVVVGTVPINQLSRTFCVPSSISQGARSYLISILDGAPVKLVWALLYERNEDFYVLNITPAQHYVIDASGGRTLVPLRNP